MSLSPSRKRVKLRSMKHNLTLFVLTSLSALVSTFPQHSFAATATCVKLSVSGATSCRDLKVVFDFEDCDDEAVATKENARILDCRGNSAVAQVQTANAIYSVQLKKDEGAWSTGEFKAVSEVNRKRIQAKKPVTPPPAAAASVKTTEEAKPVASTPAPEPTIRPALTVSGFIDAQYQIRSSAQYSPKFLLQDSALYLTHVSDRMEAKLDIPVGMKTSSTSSDFQVGTTKAQAYVQWKIDPKFRAKIGQFDTSYGFEGNDTVDLVLSRQGSVYNFCNPYTHTGLQLAFDANSFLTLNALAANPADAGTAQNKNLQYGLQAVYSSRVRASAGFLMNRDAATDVDTWTWDAVAGITIAEVFSIDFEANFSKTGDRPYTPGFLMQTSWQATEKLSWAVRAEYLKERGRKNSGSDPLLDRQYTLLVGPQYRISEFARLKLDYSLQYDQNFAADEKERLHGANLALVYRFQ